MKWESGRAFRKRNQNAQSHRCGEFLGAVDIQCGCSNVQGGERSLLIVAQAMWEGAECHAERFRVYARITRAIREVFKKYVIRTFYYKSNKDTFFFFCLHCMACGILAHSLWDLISQPEIEPTPPAVEVWHPNHWTAGNSLTHFKIIQKGKVVNIRCKKINIWLLPMPRPKLLS